MNVYVLIDAKTGDFWKKPSRNGRRGINAYMSEAKARATLKQFHPTPTVGEDVIIQRFTNETITNSFRGRDR